jgi:hypothetical protein
MVWVGDVLRPGSLEIEMAYYLVKHHSGGAAGEAAAAVIVAEMEAAGLLGVARFVPEVGGGAWVELVRSEAEIAEVVAMEFALGEYLVAIAAAKKSAKAALAAA